MINMDKNIEPKKIKINPKVLAWLIENDGRDINTIANAIKNENLQKWLNNDDAPTLKYLKKLSIVLKRPLAAFLIPEPPKEQKITDFRLTSDPKIPRETLLNKREVLRLQLISKELMENLNEIQEPQVEKVDRKVNLDELAERIRSEFELSKLQDSSKSPQDLFKKIREKIENSNIFVFLVDASIDDFRGFALSTNPATIVVNAKDIPEARNFTLFHEYAHVLLRENGICLQDRYLEADNQEAKIENWCNQFAAMCLLPKTEVEKEFRNRKDDIAGLLKYMNKRFKASKTASLFRLYNLNLIKQSSYQTRYKEAYYEKKTIIEQTAAKLKELRDKRRDKKSGFPSLTKKKLNRRGNAFINLVKANAEKGNITTIEALDYLGIGLKSYEKYIKT
jgi:Zn-dependent peptidase ImmA (M78 family)